MRSANGLAGGVLGGAVQVGGSVHGGVAFHTGVAVHAGVARPVELLFAAVQHLYSPRPLERAAWIFCLEQLACEYDGMRNTVCNILNAYRHLPSGPTPADLWVRDAALAVLGRVGRLAVPPGRG